MGVNALLAGIAMELGASVLFTPEESGKTIGSVKELAISSDMMFLAKNRGSIPKDLGINLVLFKDKRKIDGIVEDVDVPLVEAEEDYHVVHRHPVHRGHRANLEDRHRVTPRDEHDRHRSHQRTAHLFSKGGL